MPADEDMSVLRGAMTAHANSVMADMTDEKRNEIYNVPNPTSMSYWFPLIEAAGLPVPRTEMIDCGEDWWSMQAIFDGKPSVALDGLVKNIGDAVDRIGYPAFLRTGETSAKHYWNDTCFLQEGCEIAHHVYQIAEFSELCDFRGLSWRYWYVREFLPTEPAFYAFGGMPVTEEFRVFAQDGEILCAHPYWPEMSIEKPSCEDWREKLAAINRDAPEECLDLARMATRVVPGAWSVDILNTKRGWFLTDMAEMHKSFHWEGCPNGKVEVVRIGGKK